MFILGDFLKKKIRPLGEISPNLVTLEVHQNVSFV
jgi:hypothetical protein